ncbi:hypothetical protein A2U01_0073409, partial [Trifolium medium]|nr:hypothetical protein [Trifolium medium]
MAVEARMHDATVVGVVLGLWLSYKDIVASERNESKDFFTPAWAFE